jgi:iron complex transport system ATP-binding protein
LDLAARERLLNALVHLQNDVPALSTVIVTHHLEALPPSTTHAVLLGEGRIHAAGSVDAVLNSENVSTAFDHPVIVQRAGGRRSTRASDPAAAGLLMRPA